MERCQLEAHFPAITFAVLARQSGRPSLLFLFVVFYLRNPPLSQTIWEPFFESAVERCGDRKQIQ